jgi:hypothetical protein
MKITLSLDSFQLSLRVAMYTTTSKEAIKESAASKSSPDPSLISQIKFKS